MNSRKKPDFIYFDLGNVLVHFDHEIAVRNLAAVAASDPDTVRRLVFTEGLAARYERGEISTPEVCRTLRKELRTAASNERICLAISDIFELNLAVMPLVTTLRCRDTPIGILSNTCEAHWDFINRRFSISRLFPVHALSFELGATKPDEAIYLQAANRAGVPPEKIFFCDDILANVAGAVASGFDAVQFLDAFRLAHVLRSRGIPTGF
jgi:glucose-1-phosphatase